MAKTWKGATWGLGLFGASLAGEPICLESRENPVRLIELYTSQGCSSCPPAEKWLNEFVDDPDLWQRVIPIAYHVDYWDRLGWKDPYGSHENSMRQYRLKDEGLLSYIYTPSFVVNGKEWRGWFEGKSLEKEGFAASEGTLKIVIEAGEVVADYSHILEDGRLNAALLGIGLQTDVTRGENRGRTLEQSFVVLEIIERSLGKETMRFPLPTVEHGRAPRYGIVFWVDRIGDSAPMAAVGDWIGKENVETRSARQLHLPNRLN